MLQAASQMLQEETKTKADAEARTEAGAPGATVLRPRRTVQAGPGTSTVLLEDSQDRGTPITSQARIEANRANAQKSTGPRTPEGKARVAANAITHGLLCREAVLESDDRGEFEAFRAALWLDLKPVGAMEEVLVERIVAGHWRLRRAIHLDTCLMEREMFNATLLEKKYGALPEGDDSWPEDHVPIPLAVGESLHRSMSAGPLETLRRYERTIQRDLAECLRQLERLQRSRAERANLAGPAQPPGTEARRDAAASSRAEARSAHPGQTTEDVGFVSQMDLPDAEVGFVSQKARSLEEELAGFVSQAMAAGK